MEPNLLALLACPVCKGPLTAKPHSLACENCRVEFENLQGIPVLLADRAKALEAGGAG